jgi:hypothetical protein
MKRFVYSLVIVILLIWVVSLFMRFDPRGYELSLLLNFGCMLSMAGVVLSALFRRKWRALATLSLLLTVLIIGDFASFAYRLNSVCRPGYRIIHSEADAVQRAQVQIFRARYGSHGIPGYVDEKPGSTDFGRIDDCCRVARTRTMGGVIVWKVWLHGETTGEPRKRRVSAEMWLSNCGVVFDEDSTITAEPAR